VSNDATTLAMVSANNPGTNNARFFDSATKRTGKIK
jgi:hypothetical protein